MAYRSRPRRAVPLLASTLLLTLTLLLGCDSGGETPPPTLSGAYTGTIVPPNPTVTPFDARFEFLHTEGAEEDVTARVTYTTETSVFRQTAEGSHVHPDLHLLINGTRYRGTVSDDGAEIRGRLHFGESNSVVLNLEKE